MLRVVGIDWDKPVVTVEERRPVTLLHIENLGQRSVRVVRINNRTYRYTNAGLSAMPSLSDSCPEIENASEQETLDMACAYRVDGKPHINTVVSAFQMFEHDMAFATVWGRDQSKIDQAYENLRRRLRLLSLDQHVNWTCPEDLPSEKR